MLILISIKIYRARKGIANSVTLEPSCITAIKFPLQEGMQGDARACRTRMRELKFFVAF